MWPVAIPVMVRRAAVPAEFAEGPTDKLRLCAVRESIK